MIANRPWENEPDRVEFKYKGYDCLIRRAAPKSQCPKGWLGSLCGYVAVTPSHPYFGKVYDDKDLDLDAHGGLTYSGACQGEICHKTEQEDKAWWFGFDCAHFGDLIPSQAEAREPEECLYEFGESILNEGYETYKTVAFVKNEIRNLVKQLEKVI